MPAQHARLFYAWRLSPPTLHNAARSLVATCKRSRHCPHQLDFRLHMGHTRVVRPEEEQREYEERRHAQKRKWARRQREIAIATAPSPKQQNPPERQLCWTALFTGWKGSKFFCSGASFVVLLPLCLLWT
ncbi:hypothetical protein ISCGN_025250 [Ixodes scapularis]